MPRINETAGHDVVMGEGLREPCNPIPLARHDQQRRRQLCREYLPERQRRPVLLQDGGHDPPEAGSEYSSPEWKRAVSFLWNVRASQVERLEWQTKFRREIEFRRQSAETFFVAINLEPAGLAQIVRRAGFGHQHLVLGDRTRGLIGASDLASMKRSAILVNTSRGPIVDEKAIVTPGGASGKSIVAYNRLTGAPLLPVEERAVPQTDVPGEQSSPTQPFPTISLVQIGRASCRERVSSPV